MSATIFACVNPSKDFDDYTGRASEFVPTSLGDGGNFQAAPPPTEAVEGTYYGACMSQLAFYQLSKVFNFFITTKYVPDPAGGATMTLTLQSLALAADTGGPPANVSKSGALGDVFTSASMPQNVSADGRYVVDLGHVAVPGDANPISRRDILIDATKFRGFFSANRFCGQLEGNVTQPIQLTLTPPQNICQFIAIKDGDPTPVLTRDDFQTSACPL